MRYIDSKNSHWNILPPIEWQEHWETHAFLIGWLEPEPKDLNDPRLREYCRMWSGLPFVRGAVGYTASFAEENIIKHIEDLVNPKNPLHDGRSYMFTANLQWTRGSNI